MKKIIFGITALSMVFLFSCKKSYTCNCDVTKVDSYDVKMPDYGSDQEFTTNSTIVLELEKTNKAGASANCVAEEIETEPPVRYKDDIDADGDANYNETAYEVNTVTTTKCKL